MMSIGAWIFFVGVMVGILNLLQILRNKLLPNFTSPNVIRFHWMLSEAIMLIGLIIFLVGLVGQQ